MTTRRDYPLRLPGVKGRAPRDDDRAGPHLPLTLTAPTPNLAGPHTAHCLPICWTHLWPPVATSGAEPVVCSTPPSTAGKNNDVTATRQRQRRGGDATTTRSDAAATRLYYSPQRRPRRAVALRLAESAQPRAARRAGGSACSSPRAFHACAGCEAITPCFGNESSENCTLMFSRQKMGAKFAE